MIDNFVMIWHPDSPLVQGAGLAKKTINVFMLTMINIATILSVRNWPVTAEYGLASIFFIFLALIFFFFPAALVSAELATGWPQKGGIFAWVKEGLGHRVGFLAVWLLWIENVVWYPTILSFIAAAIAYIFMPSLAQSQTFMFCMILAIFWLLTYANLRGMKISGWISTVGVILGVFLPGAVIILLGFAWVFAGNTAQIDFTLTGLLPQSAHVPELAFLAGIMLSFCGIEMSAVHAKDVEQPQKNYPKAIFLSAFLITALTILGTMSIAIIIPKDKISLVAGSMEAIDLFLRAFKMEWLVPGLAFFVAIGAMGTVSTWIAGPCRGLLAAAEKGDFPPFLQKTNQHNMPKSLLVIQAAIVTVLATAFIFMPNIQSSFWVLTVLASLLYSIMYMLLFISGIVLRYKHPKTKREYKIPGGKTWGMWLTGLMGLIGMVFVIIIGFFPPPGVDVGSVLGFDLFLLLGAIVACGAPLLLYECRSESWIK